MIPFLIPVCFLQFQNVCFTICFYTEWSFIILHNSNVYEKYVEICHILHHFLAKDFSFQKNFKHCSALQKVVIGGERKQYTRRTMYVFRNVCKTYNVCLSGEKVKLKFLLCGFSAIPFMVLLLTFHMLIIVPLI